MIFKMKQTFWEATQLFESKIYVARSDKDKKMNIFSMYIEKFSIIFSAFVCFFDRLAAIVVNNSSFSKFGTACTTSVYG